MEDLKHEETCLSNTFADIHQQLRTQGYATIDEDELRVSTIQWRKIARDVAAELGRPVRITTPKSRLYAVIVDWPQPNETCSYPPYTKQAANGRHFLQQLIRPGPNIGRPL